MRPRLAVLALLVLLSLPGDAVIACTTFCLREGGHVVFGRNYDFEIGDGHVMVNKRGVSKRSVLPAGDRPAAWTSRHGSVTFNQYGRDFPTGGVNEKGLVVELMWLDETRYPAADGRPAVGVLEWIQHQLDRHATVAEVLAHVEEIRISGRVPLHYLVSDPTGASAAIEFLDGRLVARHGDALPVAVLTNHTYEASLDRLGRHEGFGGDQATPRGRSSLDRFVRAATLARQPSTGETTVARAFRILKEVANGDRTRWSIVYDLTDRVVRFRTSRSPRVRSLSLDAFDYGCDRPVMILDIEAELEGDVSASFAEYTPERNMALVAGSYGKVSFLSRTPRSVIERYARHPDTSTCASR